MSLDNGSMSPADIAAVTNNGGGFLGGFGGDSWIAIIVLFLLFGMGGWGGFGGGFGGGDGMIPWWFMNNNNDMQRGFDTSAINGQLSTINSSINAGFSSAEVANCNRAMDAMQTAYNNQIATMNQRFSDVTAISDRLDGISSSLQNCCCENRASIADLKYTVATEACADRSAINDALRDVIAANTASTQAILDKMCQQEIDALKTQNASLQTQLNMANLASSQAAQTAQLIADNTAQTQYIVNRVAPYPIPAYQVPNPYGYGLVGVGAYGYGYGMAA